MELGLFGNVSASGFNCSTTLIGVIESNFRQQRSNIASGRYHATIFIIIFYITSKKSNPHK